MPEAEGPSREDRKRERNMWRARRYFFARLLANAIAGLTPFTPRRAFTDGRSKAEYLGRLGYSQDAAGQFNADLRGPLR